MDRVVEEEKEMEKRIEVVDNDKMDDSVDSVDHVGPVDT